MRQGKEFGKELLWVHMLHWSQVCGGRYVPRLQLPRLPTHWFWWQVSSHLSSVSRHSTTALLAVLVTLLPVGATRSAHPIATTHHNTMFIMVKFSHSHIS